MRINNNPISKIMSAYDKNKTKKAEAPKSQTSQRDSITISQAAKDFQFALKALQSTPDVRMEKIDMISQAMKSGSYKVPEEDVAEKMLESSSSFDIKI